MCLLVGCTGLDQDGEIVLSVSPHHNYDEVGVLVLISEAFAWDLHLTR